MPHGLRPRSAAKALVLIHKARLPSLGPISYKPYLFTFPGMAKMGSVNYGSEPRVGMVANEPKPLPFSLSNMWGAEVREAGQWSGVSMIGSCSRRR